jgi:hypothetical protein
MPFISFIYRFGRNKRIFYGKYVTDHISDDHEGLDEEVKYDLMNAINEYRKQQNKPPLKSKLYIGVISFSDDRYDSIPTYSTDNEIKCFDFYTRSEYYQRQTYINGELIKSLT